jgi:hypothetical protein
LKNSNYIISRIPIGLFLLTVINHFVATYLLSVEVYEDAYYYLCETINTPLAVNIFMLLVVYRYKLCLYNKVSVYSLLSLNVINLFFLTANFDYEVYEFYLRIFMSFIMIPTAILAIILFIKKV